MRTVSIVALVLIIVPLTHAQTRCECEYDNWVDDCDAKFERRGDWIVFESDTQQCSRIDWHTDAQPRLTIVEDGRETVELIGLPPSAEISISSCKVCKDRLFNSQKAAPTVNVGNEDIKYMTGLWVSPNATHPHRFELFVSGGSDRIEAVLRQFFEGRNNVTDHFSGANGGRTFTLQLQSTNSGSQNGVIYGTLNGSNLRVRVLYDDGMLELEATDFRRP